MSLPVVVALTCCCLETPAMKQIRKRVIVASLVCLGATSLLTPMAYANETANPAAAVGAETKKISDGSVLSFADQNMSITPVAGWELNTANLGMTLIMQEAVPTEAAVNGEKIKFQRNMTVVSRRGALPMDEKSFLHYQEILTEKMSKDTLVSNFQIMEHKFFNHRATNDGLMFYTSMKLGTAQVMQAHVLVSGEENHFWLTYTDLAERFSADQDTFKKVWQSMVSVAPTGFAPKRYMDLMIYGSASVAFIVLVGVLFAIRRKRAISMYESDANAVYDEDTSPASSNASVDGAFTQSNVWALDGNAVTQISEEDEASNAEESYGAFSAVSSVSNFA